MATLEGLTAYLDALSGALPTIARQTAPKIEAQLRAAATTKRGNVPAYAPGAKGSPSPAIPANSVLVFDLELLSIKDPAAPAPQQ